jgi:lysophospholipase L1-like esterase
MKHLIFATILLSLALTGCAATPSATPEVPTQTAPAPAASMTTAPSLTPDSIPVEETATPEISPTATLGLDAWMFMPVIPTFSDTAREIYQRGLSMGRDPHRFSKAGDCESTTGWYLAEFDREPVTYRLGEQYDYLQTTIDYYDGSFIRESVAVRRGANTSSLLTSLWADPNLCEAGESMLACEYRLHNPSIALIAIGSNDAFGVDDFESQIRRIIEFTISEGIVPILSTKADNAEGGHKLNIILSNLAYEYDIPLWNFWLAVQPLPNHGLQPDGFHLTFGGNLFDDPDRMQNAWPWRNLTALQTLDAARQTLTTTP